MSVTRRQVRSITILSLEGRFYGDRETVVLEKAIMDEAATGNLRLVLNMGKCEALNSVGIGTIMRGYVNYKGRGGEVKLCGLGKRLKDLFVMTKLIMVIDHHDTEELALAAFAEAGA
jgi:anti-sigma B factor antagonist